jgi:hypothetical protein
MLPPPPIQAAVLSMTADTCLAVLYAATCLQVMRRTLI